MLSLLENFDDCRTSLDKKFTPLSILLRSVPPTGVWTKDRLVVEQEKQRLLPWRTTLNDLIDQARDSDRACTWYMMAEAALPLIDRDLDDLYEWLEATERDDAICEEPVR